MTNKPLPMPVFSDMDKDRFWVKVEKTNSINDCWMWSANRGKRGYGQYSVKYDKKTRWLIASRVSYYLYNNIDPLDNIVLHKCDTPSCCNPNHLFIGTSSDNSRDMMNKGRGLNQFEGGEGHHHARLTTNNVIDIKKAYSTGVIKMKDIAKSYNIDPSAISRVINNKRWKHIQSIEN